MHHIRFMYWPSNVKETVLFPFSEYDGPDTGVYGGDTEVANKILIFKPGAWLKAGLPGFLKLLWFACQYVCVSAPNGINKQWRDMV